jgi:hypothetical protein
VKCDGGTDYSRSHRGAAGRAGACRLEVQRSTVSAPHLDRLALRHIGLLCRRCVYHRRRGLLVDVHLSDRCHCFRPSRDQLPHSDQDDAEEEKTSANSGTDKRRAQAAEDE